MPEKSPTNHAEASEHAHDRDGRVIRVPGASDTQEVSRSSPDSASKGARRALSRERPERRERGAVASLPLSARRMSSASGSIRAGDQ